MQGHCSGALGRTHNHYVLQTSPVSSVLAADAFCEETAIVYHCKREALWIHEHLDLHRHQIVKQEESAAMVILRGQECRQRDNLCALMQTMMMEHLQ